jgi:putative RecB family exonuclease
MQNTPVLDDAISAISEQSINLGQFIAWDNDALVVTDHETLEKVKRKALSPSTSKSMASCQSRWLVERIMPSEENPFDPAPLGTSGHLCLERMFTLPGEQRTPDQLMTEVLTLASEEWGNDVHGPAMAEKHRWVGEVHSKIAPIFTMEDPKKVVVHTNELQMVDVKVGGVPFNGFIDRVDIVTDEDGNEGISVIDYKTGKVPKNITHFGDDHGDQLRLYALAYKAKFGVMPVEAWVYYTAHGVTKKVSLAKTSLSKTLKAFQTSWNSHNTAMESARFNTKPGPLCGWCAAVESCPSAIKKDGTMYSRSPRAAAFVDLGIPVFKPSDSPAVAPEPAAAELDAPVQADVAVAPAVVETNDEAPVASGFAHDPEPIFDESMIRDYQTTGLTTDGNKSSKRDATDTSEPQEGSRTTEEHMTEKRIFGDELKPWEEGDGRLNPASYAAQGVFGMVEFAMDILAEADQKITPKAVKAVAGSLAKIVLDAQVEIAGKADWNAGLNTRLRGALRTALKTSKVPFGGTAADYEAWVSKVTRLVIGTANISASLFEDFDNDLAEPWLILTEAPAAVSAA